MCIRDSSYTLLSEIASEEGDFSKANSYADSTIYYSTQFDSPRLESEAHLSKYHILKSLGQTYEQQYHIKKSFAAALNSNHNQSILDAAAAYADYESSQSRFKSGFAYQSIADSLRKEIFSEELTTQLDDLEKRILLQKSQEEIDLSLIHI